MTSCHDMTRHDRSEHDCSHLNCHVARTASPRAWLLFCLVVMSPSMKAVTLAMCNLWAIPPIDNDNEAGWFLFHINCAQDPTCPCGGFFVLTSQLHRISLDDLRLTLECHSSFPFLDAVCRGLDPKKTWPSYVILILTQYVTVLTPRHTYTSSRSEELV